ncbi:MAG TPA: YegS/Rv2252/BmrU family lipid kinase [Acidimicrobiales bacterium]
MKTIAVIAHKKKTFGGGLGELRQLLRGYGYADPLWYEATNSRETAQFARNAVEAGAELLLVWGGDGTVQRCINAVVDFDVELALLPAGTANLLAMNLKIPLDLKSAVEVAIHGKVRPLDVGVLNGKCFAVMAGVGFDAVIMKKADGNAKDRFGRLAYLWTGIQSMRVDARWTEIRVDGRKWFTGEATCVLIGQMNSVARGVSVFPVSRPDDGLIEVGVVTAKNALQWASVLARMVVGKAHLSTLTQMTQGREIDIVLDRPTLYELDGGARKARKSFEVKVRPDAIKVRIPRASSR